ncbi:hypothetical protein D3C84_1020350 [compost metagenome]
MRGHLANRVFVLVVAVDRTLFKAIMDLLVVGNLKPRSEESIQVGERLNLPLFNEVIRLGNKALVNESEELFLFPATLRTPRASVL